MDQITYPGLENQGSFLGPSLSCCHLKLLFGSGLVNAHAVTNINDLTTPPFCDAIDEHLLYPDPPEFETKKRNQRNVQDDNGKLFQSCRQGCMIPWPDPSTQTAAHLVGTGPAKPPIRQGLREEAGIQEPEQIPLGTALGLEVPKDPTLAI